MPIELKDVVEFLGYKADEIKELPDLKAKFDADFVRASNINEDSEPVKKIMGKLFGTLENEIKKVTKAHDLDIDFDAEEIKGKKVNEKLKLAFSKYDEKNKSILDDLKIKAGQGNDEKVKEWETKFDKMKTKYHEVDELLKKTSGDFEGFKLQKDNEIKNVKLNVHKSDIYSKAKFIPDINEFTKKGFLTDFESKYDLALDENEKPIITDKKGQRIPNPKTAGTFFEPMDLLQEETIKAKLYPLNKDAGKPMPGKTFVQQAIEGVPQRKLARRLG